MIALRIALEWTARALWRAADRLRPAAPPPVGTYTVRWVLGWAHSEFGPEPRLSCELAKAPDCLSGLAALEVEGPEAMQAHEWTGEVVLMDPDGRRVASWMGSRRLEPAPAG